MDFGDFCLQMLTVQKKKTVQDTAGKTLLPHGKQFPAHPILNIFPGSQSFLSLESGSKNFQIVETRISLKISETDDFW